VEFMEAIRVRIGSRCQRSEHSLMIMPGDTLKLLANCFRMRFKSSMCVGCRSSRGIVSALIFQIDAHTSVTQDSICLLVTLQ